MTRTRTRGGWPLPANTLDIVVFDFETGGLKPGYHEAVQVAGKAYCGRTLEPYPPAQGGEFCSLMRPLYPERLDERALAVNGKTRAELLAAPDQGVVWNQFVAWVGRFAKNSSPLNAPIAAGKNIRHFDLKFADALNRLHCKRKEKTVLFNQRRQLELEDLFFSWFEDDHDADLPNEKMDTLRGYFGMSREGAHDALVDVRQTGLLVVLFLRLHRRLRATRSAGGGPLLRFKNALAGRVAA